MSAANDNGRQTRSPSIASVVRPSVGAFFEAHQIGRIRSRDWSEPGASDPPTPFCDPHGYIKVVGPDRLLSQAKESSFLERLSHLLLPLALCDCCFMSDYITI